MREVAIALLWRGQRLLTAKRPAGALEGGAWEFPGGKCEPGESPERALVRECQEELGVAVVPVAHAWTTELPREFGTLRLLFFHARLATDAEPEPRAADGLAWRSIAELAGLPFCTGDAELLEALADGRVAPPL